MDEMASRRHCRYSYTTKPAQTCAFSHIRTHSYCSITHLSHVRACYPHTCASEFIRQISDPWVVMARLPHLYSLVGRTAMPKHLVNYIQNYLYAKIYRIERRTMCGKKCSFKTHSIWVRISHNWRTKMHRI